MQTTNVGEYLTDAEVQINKHNNEPFISLSFSSKGAKLFERITGDNINKRLAIVLDKRVMSAPVIQSKIGGGMAMITGRFTMDEARDLAIVLRAGALPAPIKIMESKPLNKEMWLGYTK